MARLRDPSMAQVRRAAAARRVGEDERCGCGETETFALIEGRRPATCVECDRLKRGKSIMDRHHIAGKNNNPLTISIPANLHRVLSERQYDWPKRMLENPKGNLLIETAGMLQGFIDLQDCLLDRGLRPILAKLVRIADAQTQHEKEKSVWKKKRPRKRSSR
jgi:hypothetical protein